MADPADIRARIVTSVFDRRRATTGISESYVGHLKIWEETEDGSDKPRYVLLSQSNDGQGYIHKAKMNANGTFSVGKTWPVAELRAVEVITSTIWAISFARTYKWQSDNAAAQADFTVALVRLYRAITGGGASLRVIGVTEDAAPRSNNTARPPPTPSRVVPSSTTSSTHTSDALSPRGTPARPGNPPRVASPSVNGRNSPTPAVAPIAAARPRPGRPRALSNSSRLSTGTSYSAVTTIPALNLPSSPPPPRTNPPPLSANSSYAGEQRERDRSRDRRPEMPTSSSTGSLAAPTPRRPEGNGTPPRGTATPDSSRSRRTPNSRDDRERDRDREPEREAIQVQPRADLAPPPVSRKASERKDGDTAKRPDPNARVSFFDAPNQATLDRLITGGLLADGTDEGEGEEALEVLDTVEEMLDAHEWPLDRAPKGPEEQVEGRLLGELLALDKANIYSFLESDDRINLVLNFIDKAVSELDSMDNLLSSYKIHLNTVTDDISHIQSQNRGLQVQTQNQKALLAEVENLLQMVQVEPEALTTLARESLREPAGIERVEAAATQLYKALQAGRDRDMAATMERLGEYQTHNAQFCTRVLDFLSILFTAQGSLLLGTTDGIMEGPRGRVVLVGHKDMETMLGRYAGVLLYLREMDEQVYGRVCANYFSTVSGVHAKQIKALFAAYDTIIKKDSEEDGADQSTTPTSTGFRPGLRRAGTLMRIPGQGRKDRDKGGGQGEASMRASEGFADILESIAPLIYSEEEFIADFLQINDAGLTFADYMGLDNYYRRQASRAAGLQPATIKLVRGAMDLIFGFLPAEFKGWIDRALAKDNLQVIGITAALERFLVEAEERGNAFLMQLLEKQHARLKGLFNNHVNEQITIMESTKVSTKKRSGTAPFIKLFPAYISRVESQLAGAGGLEVRASVDAGYDKIVTKMFDLLRQLAKLDGSEGEDKGQMNYHVFLIENMHHFVAEMAQVQLGAVGSFVKRAEGIYDENLQAYIKLVLRKPFAKIIDYFEGVERLLKTTAPSEVSSNSSYNKSALKKVVKEYNAKDVRKHVDALSRRVEKHFTDADSKALADGDRAGAIAPGTVLVGVWRACEDELLRLTEAWGKRISQCYADAGVSLEYSQGDVEAAFKKHRVGA